MQKVTSAYTKTNSPVRFNQNSQVVYADKNKTTKLLRTIGFQLPIPLQSSGYVGSISYDDGFVKVQGVPFSKVVLESNDTQNQRRSGSTFVSREAMQEYRQKRHESELKNGTRCGSGRPLWIWTIS